MSLKNQTQNFKIPDNITYLNTASQSPIFNSVYEAGLKGLMQKSQPYSITVSDYFEPVTELKKLFAKLIDASDYNRIASIPSVSYGMATVANNIILKPEDEILVVDEQFPSNIYSWQKLAEKYGATLRLIAMPTAKVNRVRDWNANILDAISNHTAVVAMGNIHWSNGSLFDLKAIREKSKQHNALLIIDGSQTVGAFPFSINDIQPDALICAGYKWLFGPYGCAYAYFGSYFDSGEPIEENWSNRLDSENFAGLTNYQSEYKPLANRYAVGESGNFIYVQMQIAALKQIIEWTPKAIQDYCKSISEKAVIELQNLGCYVEEAESRTHHLFGVEIPKNLDINLLKTEMKKRNIYVSFRGRYVRLSCHVFNTEKHFEAFVSCVSYVLNKV